MFIRDMQYSLKMTANPSSLAFPTSSAVPLLSYYPACSNPGVVLHIAGEFLVGYASNHATTVIVVEWISGGQGGSFSTSGSISVAT